MIKHIERMGDQCVNIAKLIPLSGHEPPVRPKLLETLLKMGAHLGFGDAGNLRHLRRCEVTAFDQELEDRVHEGCQRRTGRPRLAIPKAIPGIASGARIMHPVGLPCSTP